MGKEKVENREKRGTIEPRSTIWRKDKAERGLGFSNIYLCLSSFRIGFLFFYFFFGFMFFFLKYCVDVDNYGSLRGFGFI